MVSLVVSCLFGAYILWKLNTRRVATSFQKRIKGHPQNKAAPPTPNGRRRGLLFLRWPGTIAYLAVDRRRRSRFGPGSATDQAIACPYQVAQATGLDNGSPPCWRERLGETLL